MLINRIYIQGSDQNLSECLQVEVCKVYNLRRLNEYYINFKVCFQFSKQICKILFTNNV